ncbi:unnamed protein product [Merluccius merluccius]
MPEPTKWQRLTGTGDGPRPPIPLHDSEYVSPDQQAGGHNGEVSLVEAGAVASVTALLKSEALAPVNGNLAPRLPLSH